MNSKNIILPNQIHSNIVLKVDKNSLSSLKADALITCRDDILLGILTADCAPILFFDSNFQIFRAIGKHRALPQFPGHEHGRAEQAHLDRFI